jgi:raffinose synthase
MLCSVDLVQLPSFLDWFGWCTWDAFYTDVTAEGVKEGLER